MEDEQREVPVVKHSIFRWEIVNILMALTKKKYSTKSEIFSFADCNWSLLLHCEHEDHDYDRIHLYVELLRHGRDNNFSRDEIRTRTSITLKTVTDTVIAKEVFEHSFAEWVGHIVISYNTSWQNVCVTFHEDTFVIVCDMNAVTHYDYDHRLSDNQRLLSSDVYELLDTPGNAHLLTGDGRMLPVYKEILSARSPAFRKQFSLVQISLFGGFRQPDVLPLSFSEEVVAMMLRFIYSGRIREAVLGNLPSPELYECAMKYKIFDLEKILKPENVHMQNVINCSRDNVLVIFEDFAKITSQKQCETKNPLSETCLMTRNISLYENNVKGRVCVFDHGTGNLSFQAQLWHALSFPVPTAISALLYVDIFGFYRYKMPTVADFNNEGICILPFELDVKYLFLNANDLLPNGTLTLQCEFKLRLNAKEICSLSTDSATRPSYNDGYIFDLDSDMKYLLESRLFTDATVYTNEDFRMHVHKSVMSARYPPFREANDTVRLDLPTEAAKALVYYIYTGKIRNFSAILPLYTFADINAMPELRDECIRTANFTPLNHWNVLTKYAFAILSDDRDLRLCCKNFILRNKDLLLGTRQWDNFRYPNVLREEILPYINQNV